MSFHIRGLSRESFAHLFAQPAHVLAGSGAERVIVDCSPGYPDRITLDDVPAGEPVLLVNYTHQAADTPFRASHAIYVREQAAPTFDGIDAVPPALARRLISLRAFDDRHRMIDAEIAPGQELAGLIERLFANPAARYLHAHYAKWGCYAARIDRA